MERGQFTQVQRNALLAPVQSWRVMQTDGQSHLAAFDVIAHLNRMFGFEGWDKEILTLDLVYQHSGEREVKRRRNGVDETQVVPAHSVGYRCTLRLTVRDTSGQVVRVIEDAAMGTATNQRDLGDAHDLAVKSAVSYALKRCAKDLGDQFGLSLYNKGSEDAVVMQVFPYGHEGEVVGQVHADGIEESDSGMGPRRDGATEPAPEPAPAVREPAPARSAKPEATPPAPPAAVPELTEEEEISYAQEIEAADQVADLKILWGRVQNAGHLDALVLDLKTEVKMTLRELMVRRVSEIETGVA